MAASFAGVDMELSKVVVFGDATSTFFIDEAVGTSLPANVDADSKHIKINSPLLFESCPKDPVNAFVTIDFYYKLRP